MCWGGLSAAVLSVVVLSVSVLNVTLLSVIALSVIALSVVALSVVMPSVVVLSVVMQGVVVLSVIVLSVVLSVVEMSVIWTGCLGAILQLPIFETIFLIPFYFSIRAHSNLPLYSLSPEAGLLNKSSCLAQALGVTKYTIVRDMISATLCCAT